MRKLITIIMMLACLASYGQEKIKQATMVASSSADSDFVFSDVDNLPDGVTVFGKLWQLGSLSVKKEGKKSDTNAGNTMIPSVLVINENGTKTQQFMNLEGVMPDMKGLTYKATYLDTKAQFASNEDPSANEVRLKFPKAFNEVPEETPVFYDYNFEVSLWDAGIREIQTKFKVDRQLNRLIPEPVKGNVITPKLPAVNGKYIYDAQYLKDNKERMLICSGGINVKGSGRLDWMKGRKVMTFSSTGDLLNSFDVEFAFPRSCIFAKAFGSSEADTISTFNQGGIFLYGKVFGGGKHNDPDPTNYEYIIVGPKGESVGKGSFKFGAEKQALEILYAFKKDDKIFVFGKAITREPNLAVLVFDKTGLIETKRYGVAELKAFTSGSYDKGVAAIHAYNFRTSNHVTLKDGGALICGETWDEIDLPVAQNTTTANNSFPAMTAPKGSSYAAKVFIHIDGSGNIVKQYVIEKTSADEKKSFTKLKLIQDTDNKFYFVGQQKDQGDVFPVLVSVDLTKGAAGELKLQSESLYNVAGQIIYRYYPERSQILFLGRNNDKKSYSLNCVIYKL